LIIYEVSNPAFAANHFGIIYNALEKEIINH